MRVVDYIAHLSEPWNDVAPPRQCVMRAANRWAFGVTIAATAIVVKLKVRYKNYR